MDCGVSAYELILLLSDVAFVVVLLVRNVPFDNIYLPTYEARSGSDLVCGTFAIRKADFLFSLVALLFVDYSLSTGVF